ncbi:hypothetical protein BVG79_p1000150 (plasmid) [Ketogulonicigenium robustum]|uniref:Oxidoreductase n=2 Tax=Ketogulonicigenium robustum TaxID=92947 RepID=A0A1W6P369_9RHOB|nr:hypothetical protein BVG79_p1000150 [Ketogulonicigenium robustum]
MIGGGTGAFMGYVHRIAARLDGNYELVAGALSSRPDVAQSSGRALGLADDRIYSDFTEMARAESTRPDGVEVVAIVTPNHMHVAPARAFLQAGIHVICDKPLAGSLAEAEELAAVTPANGARFLLTHTYTGYPLVRLARDMVARGDLGTIRMVQVEYAQDWLTVETPDEQAGTAWRADPAKSGGGGAIADIGTHAYNLARFVSGLQLHSLSADLDSFVPGRRVDDNAHIMLRFQGGAKGMLWASQVAVGNENSIRLRVFGDKASLDWQHTQPNELTFTRFGEARQIITRNGAGSNGMGRIPSGHPEGYLEAFATLYDDFAAVIRTGADRPLPTLADGVEGMRFITSALASAQNDARWQPLV